MKSGLFDILDNKDHLNDWSKIFIIAEIANAHQGNPQLAYDIITEVAQTGADAVKFQIYSADELYSPLDPGFKKFREREWAFDVWKNLFSYSWDSGLEVGADIFGKKSLEIALSLKVDFLKIHSSDLSNYPLIKDVARKPYPLLLSAGGTTLLELAQAIETVRKEKTDGLGLMYGYQAFPTDIADSHFSRINRLKALFGLHIGLADHIDGDLEMAIDLPLIALGLGCRIFEKHITLDRSAKGTDYISSLEPIKFEHMVNQLREGLIALGSEKDIMGKAENNYRSKMKKHVTAGESLESGTILSEEKLALHRIEDQILPPVPINSWIGKKLLRPVKKGHVFKYNDIEQKVGLCIVARLQSERLPGKALVDIAGKPSLAHLFEKAQLAKDIAKPVLCTTINSEDDKLVDLAFSYDIEVIRGDTKNVLSRLISAIDEFGFDIVLRVTGDDIFLDPPHVKLLIEFLRKNNYDYASSMDLPGGFEAEAFTSHTLKTIDRFAEDLDYTEYLRYYVDDSIFSCGNLPVEEKYRRDYGLSLDTPEDLAFINNVFRTIYSEENFYSLDDIIDYVDNNLSLIPHRKSARKDNKLIQKKCKLNFSYINNNNISNKL